jgi:hypothetical protein
VIPIIKPGKYPALPSSYQTISLLDTIGKLFENILLTGTFHLVLESNLMGNEQFGFKPRHNTSLHLARLFERIAGNFGDKRPTGAVFLDVAKAFDIFWIDSILNKLTLLNYPSYIVNTISSYLRGRTFEASFLTTISRWEIRARVSHGGLIFPVPFSVYFNAIPSHSHHAELNF